jgi:hypothetical protein
VTWRGGSPTGFNLPRVYAEAVEDAFGAEVDYAMLVKVYGASSENPESRQSPAIGVLVNPAPDHISTSFLERRGAPLYATHEHIQQETGESRAHGGALLHGTTTFAESTRRCESRLRSKARRVPNKNRLGMKLRHYPGGLVGDQLS